MDKRVEEQLQAAWLDGRSALSLFIVSLLSLMLGQIVIYEDQQFIQQFAGTDGYPCGAMPPSR
jgi:hypothetical protein